MDSNRRYQVIQSEYGLCGAVLGIASQSAGANEPGLMAISARPGKPVIARAWHGKTRKAKADEYEQYLTAAIKKFPMIKGNLGYQLMRLDSSLDGDEYVEFQVISYSTAPPPPTAQSPPTGQLALAV